MTEGKNCQLAQPVIEYGFARLADLHTRITAQIAQTIRDAIAVRNKAVLALAGGNTPKPVYQMLAALDLPWDKITITLTDERVVPFNHADANSKMVQEIFSPAIQKGLRIIPWLSGNAGHASNSGDANALAKAITAQLPAWLPFDLVLLGMGVDGHTASLFPDAPQYLAAISDEAPPACVVMDTQMVKYQRLSLNLSALLRTEQTILFWTGSDKWPIYQSAAANEAPYPVGIVLGRSAPLQTWYSVDGV